MSKKIKSIIFTDYQVMLFGDDFGDCWDCKHHSFVGGHSDRSTCKISGLDSFKGCNLKENK